MAFNYVKNQTNKNIVPVNTKLPGMSQNDGGGYTYTITKWQFLDRFLIIGASEGTYYVSADKNQTRNVNNVLECIKEDGVRVVNRLTEVSEKNLSQKNDHAIYTLALCFTHGNEETKRASEEVLNRVVRTGTHILMFTAFIKSMRGFGKLVSRAINNWYLKKDEMSLAFQLSKYQNRDGWSHKDVFRLTHPKFGKTTNKNKIVGWAIGKGLDSRSENDGIKLLQTIDKCRGMTSKEIIPYIEKFNLQREHLDTNLLNDLNIQRVMLKNLGGTALLRNLGNMSKSGLLTNINEEVKYICNKFEDAAYIKKNKLHPLQILVAQKTYQSGHGLLGNSSWPVNNYIVNSLESGFFKSFDSVEPTNKNYFFGLDISGSMTSRFNGSYLSCHEICAVMALTFAKAEPWVFVGGFGTMFHSLQITRRDDLKSAMKKTQGNFGSTNPGSAIQYAITNKMDVDTFVFITDNDVNTGNHPSKLLAEYRNKMKKPNAKMIVFGLTSSNFSIADPKDPLMLDCAGFSPDMTSLIQNF